MKGDKKNIFDSFLEKYDQYSSKKMVGVETYYRPSKKRCIIGFSFCLVFFLIFIRIFAWDIKFFLILIVDILCLLYFGLNLFTKRGFVIKKKYNVPEEYIKSNSDEENYNNYDIDIESYEEDRFDIEDEYEVDNLDEDEE